MITPSQDYRRTQVTEPVRLTKGLDAVTHAVVGFRHRTASIARHLEELAVEIHHEADKHRNLSDRRLKEGLNEVRVRLRRQGPGCQEAVPKALGLLVETADRTLALRPYPVQIMGALALNRGYLVEMATGEGKSLTAVMAAVMAGWTEHPCHILTVNDYLAARDAFEFRPCYGFCNVSVASVLADTQGDQRRRNYESGVVYTTSKELLADFLRDRIQLGKLHHPQRRLIQQILQPHRPFGDAIVLRGINTAIVDEADSVLIDEAVTPLIISAAKENEPLLAAARAACGVADEFRREIDYQVDEKYREITFTEPGYQLMASVAEELPGIWRGRSRSEEIIKQAITAREFYQRDQQYVVLDDKVVIVDEFTGRLMHNRSWGHGLHQAVEAAEGVDLSNPTETLARLSFQRFFRLFRRLSGTTGTAKEATDEFWHIYRLPVLEIRTNRPNIRVDLEDRLYPDGEMKWQAIVAEIKSIHQTGRAILVGTRSVNASEKLASMLDQEQLKYKLLNANRHQEEAVIVASAGEAGCITIATNMAGRGTDIKLSIAVRNTGGLHVIVTERNDSGRIDRQLIGRCARQGDPGSCRIFASLDDQLASRFLSKISRKALVWLLSNDKYKVLWIVSLVFAFAQKAAQRIAYRQRKSVLRMDTWLEEALAFSGRGTGS